LTTIDDGYPMTAWRFVFDGPGDAAKNMAVDEALYLSALSGDALPTVRLYTWARPSISIGYRQSMAEACDLHACRKLGVETVRRMSGGRAVLHQHELTYCVTSSADGVFSGLSVREVYAWVTGALRAAFGAMNVSVDPPAGALRQTASRSEPALALPCFAVPTGHEITAGGKKLVGGAQKWTRRGFLQHGSIILKLDAHLWRTTTRLQRVSDLDAVGLDDLAGRDVKPSELARAIRDRFERQFGEPPSSEELTEREKRTADILTRRKYGSPAWNIHRRAPILTEVYHEC
jgi:lipoate-protein ligase A